MGEFSGENPIAGGVLGGAGASLFSGWEGGGLLGGGAIIGDPTAGGILPKFDGIAGADALPGAGPMAANVFDAAGVAGGGIAGAAAMGGAEAAVIGKGPESTIAQGTTDAVSQAKLTFETDPSKANILVNEKGEVKLNDKNMPKNGATEIKAYMDPKFDGKDPAKLDAVIKSANEKLEAQGIKAQIQKPTDMASAVKAAQEAQTKAAKTKAETDKQKPDAVKPKAPVPGGGGGGGGGEAPKPKPHTPDAPKHEKKDHSNNASNKGLPENFNKMSSKIAEDHTATDGSHYKGMHPDGYKDFTQAVYNRIPAFSQAGGIGDQLSAIDDDPSLTPEQKAAKKAALMEKFQKEHAQEIKDGVEAYRKESGEFGDKGSDAGFESMAKSLADPSKAGDIASLLSKKQEPGTTVGQIADKAGKVFDSSAQSALANLAEIEAKGADWKSTSKNKADLEAAAKAQGNAVAGIITGINADGTKYKFFNSK
jgi:hypothetical protein